MCIGSSNCCSRLAASCSTTRAPSVDREGMAESSVPFVRSALVPHCAQKYEQDCASRLCCVHQRSADASASAQYCQSTIGSQTGCINSKAHLVSLLLAWRFVLTHAEFNSRQITVTYCRLRAGRCYSQRGLRSDNFASGPRLMTRRLTSTWEASACTS